MLGAFWVRYMNTAQQISLYKEPLSERVDGVRKFPGKAMSGHCAGLRCIASQSYLALIV